MLTLFSIPKAFHGDTATIQRNAIQSWMRLRPSCEILLMGEDPGTADTVREFGLRHIGTVKRNVAGTPLVSDLFARATEAASHEILCYVNADIILMSDFLAAVQRVLGHLKSFLMVGQRWDLEVKQALDFSEGWEADMKARARSAGRLHGPTGPDYFVFARGMWRSVPPFAVGRTAWDMWFIHEARCLKVPVVDLTRATTVIHQNHGFSHHPGGKEGIWQGEEARQNLALLGGYRNACTLRDATHILGVAGLRKRLVPWDLKRCLLLPITTHRIIRPGIQWLKSAIGHRSTA